MTKEESKILLIDDDPLVLESLVLLFEDDYDVTAVASGEEALDSLETKGPFDAVVLDIRMPRMDGLETFAAIKEVDRNLPVILYTGYPGEYSEESIHDRLCPFDFISKHEPSLHLQRSLEHAVTMRRLSRYNGDLKDLAREQYRMISSSQSMYRVYKQIEQAAACDLKVLIQGPTGTGKRLVAEAIHRRSRRARRKRELVTYLCSNKSRQPVESELFGHKKGSFTDARYDRQGVFEYADGGTLLLDEISNLDEISQEKLLGVLDNGEFTVYGAPQPRRVDVRIVCTTNRNLKEIIDDGRFRSDLFYRLNEIVIDLPALRDRREDIPDLVDYFSEKTHSDLGSGIRMFTAGARDLLIDYDWPGNVRELKAVVTRAITFAETPQITADDIRKELEIEATEDVSPGSFRQMNLDWQKKTLIKYLDKFDGNRTAVARALELDPANLRRLLKKFTIS